jgi:hypothetical protein
MLLNNFAQLVIIYLLPYICSWPGNSLLDSSSPRLPITLRLKERFVTFFTLNWLCWKSFQFSYFRQNFCFSRQNLKKSSGNYGKFSIKLRKICSEISCFIFSIFKNNLIHFQNIFATLSFGENENLIALSTGLSLILNSLHASIACQYKKHIFLKLSYTVIPKIFLFRKFCPIIIYLNVFYSLVM